MVILCLFDVGLHLYVAFCVSVVISYCFLASLCGCFVSLSSHFDVVCGHLIDFPLR